MYQSNVIPPKIAAQTVNPVIKNSSPPQKGGHGHKHEKKINIPALSGAIIGTIVPMLLLKKKQDVSSVWKINYEFYEMMYVGTGSILGGLAAGIMQNSKKAVKKIKEANYQWIMNLFFPTYFVDQFLKIIEGKSFLNKKLIDVKHFEKMSKLNKRLLKAGSVIAGISLGMVIGKVVTDKVNDLIFPNNKEKKRKIHLKDALIHVDDLPIALTLSKVPHIDKLLPICFGICGYNAGKEE